MGDAMDASDVNTGGRPGATDEIDGLRRQIEEEQQRNLRLLAEFDNFRRRAVREQDGARDEGRRRALLPLLAVLDTLERALAAGSTDRAFYEGVAATQQLFTAALGAAGAEPVESVGRRFDPSIHEAIGTQASDDVEPGVVAREVQRGWRVGPELLRAAQVVVATSPQENPDGRSDVKKSER
jgi:molecular chaperone GrpE